MFLPGESQGQGSLVGFHLWGRTESDTTEATYQQQQQQQGLKKINCIEALVQVLAQSKGLVNICFIINNQVIFNWDIIDIALY